MAKNFTLEFEGNALMESSFRIDRLKHAFIAGGRCGIGEALVRELKSRGVYVTWTSRKLSSGSIQFNPNDESQYEKLAGQLREHPPIDLFINALGTLAGSSPGPEKSLRDVSFSQFEEVFKANAFFTPLLAKSLMPFLSRTSPGIFCALSAMVGSISDNKLGGWYSYRASKAALNMILKTISLEFPQRGLKNFKVVALHPGTTETDLSKDFLRGLNHKVWQPRESAKHILNTLENLKTLETGVFKNWDGQDLDW